MNFGRETSSKIQVVVFWAMTPFSVQVGYRRFGGSCWFLPRTFPFRKETAKREDGAWGQCEDVRCM